MLKIINKNCQF